MPSIRRRARLGYSVQYMARYARMNNRYHFSDKYRKVFRRPIFPGADNLDIFVGVRFIPYRANNLAIAQYRCCATVLG